MKFRYRGFLYGYYLSHTEAIPQSVMHYQGVFYSREIQSYDLPKISLAKLSASSDFQRQNSRLGWQKKHSYQLWRMRYRLLAKLWTRRSCQKVQPLLHDNKRVEY